MLVVNALAVVLLALAAGCGPPAGALLCTTSADCGGSGGICQTIGPGVRYCSYDDPGCASGARYGSQSGGLSNTCVGDDRRSVDASVDASVVAPPGAACFGTGSVSVCLPAAPTSPAVLGSMTINTDSSPMCAMLTSGGKTDACVIAGTSAQIQSGATVVAVGSRPLVVVATTTLSVAGTIDVASHRGGSQGAASNSSLCGMGAAATFTIGSSGGGGFGGSFGGKGGTGETNDGGTGGTPAAATPTPMILRGGCAGGAGGGTANSGGSGGSGGGAVYAIAKGSITVAGSINASGAAGSGGGTQDLGGGGGGSGGMIGLEAPMITVAASGRVFANGGGGGGGGGETNTGNPGNESLAGATASGGTGGAPEGGSGGPGSQGATLTGGNGGTGVRTDPLGGGGGGGGGGAGVITVHGAATLGGVVSPSPS